MQATDLFLGLLAKQGLIQNSESLPQKADNLSPGTSSFQSIFDTLVRRPVEKSSSDNLAGGTTNSKDASNLKNAATVKSTVRKQAAKVSTPEVKTNSGETNTTQASDSNDVSATRQAASIGTQTTAADNSTSASAELKDTDAKISALVDKIEREIEKGKGAGNDDLIALIMQLIALMLAGQNTSESGNTEASTLTLNLDVEKDSKIYKILDLLLKGQGDAGAKGLENAKVLLKLSDDQGLLIPVSELAENATTEKSDDQSKLITLQLLANDGSDETESLKLTITADDMKAAKLVSLSDPALTESDLVMMIPIEDLAVQNESGKVVTAQDIAEIIQQAAKDSTDQKVASAEVSARIHSTEGETAIADVKTASDDTPQVLVPLKTATQSTTTDVETSDPMFLASDKYLKALDAETLAKKLTEAGGKEKEAIFQKLQKLLFGSDSGITDLGKLLAKKNDGTLFFMKGALEELAKQGKQDIREAAATTATSVNEDSSSGSSSGIQTMQSSERIPFLGRPAQTNGFEQMFTKTAEAQRQAPTQNLNESVMRQIVQNVNYTFMNGNEGEVRVFLRPENLGDLKLKIKVEQDVVTAKFTASSNEVKAIIESNMSQLKQALDQLGIKVGKFQVEVNSGGGQQQNAAQEQSGDSFGSSGLTANQTADAIDGYGAAFEYEYDDLAYGSANSVSGNLSRHNYLA